MDYSKKFLDGINSHCGNAIDVKRALSQFKNKKESQTETDLFDKSYFDEKLVLFRETIKSGFRSSKIRRPHGIH